MSSSSEIACLHHTHVFMCELRFHVAGTVPTEPSHSLFTYFYSSEFLFVCGMGVSFKPHAGIMGV